MKELNLFNIEHNIDSLAKGKCLISEPFAEDTYFSRSVILITEDNDTDGTVGFVLNKLLPVNVNTFFPDIPTFNAPCFLGGPVNSNTIYYMHTRPDLLTESVHIKDNLFWGGNINDLKKAIITETIKPNEIKLFVGYSGWKPNQLKKEIEDNCWLVSDIDTELVMNTNGNVWKQLLSNKGDDYLIWANAPVSPIFN